MFLSRYADVAVCYRDPVMRSDKKAEFGPKFGVGTPLYKHHTTSLVFNDPPLHTRVRKLLAAAFTPRALAALQPRIEAVVDGLLAEHADKGRMDLVEDFAFRLPVEVICDMLGVPAGERAPFRRYSLAILGALEPVAGPERQAAGNAAVAEFSAYLDDLVAERRKRPADDRDVLGTLIHGEVDGERLTHDELVQNCIFLLNAGHETTTNLIGNTIDALLRFPDELRRLQAESRAAQELRRGRPALRELQPARQPTAGGRPRDRRRDARSRHLHPYRHRRGQPRSRRSSPSPTASMPAASPTATSPSARASICAWAPCWRAWRARSPSAGWSAASTGWRATARPSAAAAPASAASTAIRSLGTSVV